ncbi:hypothetical protein CROQUDRAFT_97922 [Cronartium quercuum f. sp. fusiforme G11]|uniref:Uncharacterized protein n=1 Tax=Cronartium quercuum f. sp. fusiforme G11 TaxID=708437 RepID=A0A9P6NAQ3_9BASI|nr:hypothetical protein CROQUDRAFT_97922 [Cronartium quercuum f. sp. fusiforme G11]
MREVLGDRNSLKPGTLWFFVLSNILETLSHFIPSLYHFVANIVSRVILGLLSEKVSTHLISASTSAVAAILVVLFWGALRSLGLRGLLALSVILVVTSRAWSLYFAIIKEWNGILGFTREVGDIIAGPIPSALLQNASSTPTKSGSSSGYSGVITFFGASMFATVVVESDLFVHQLILKNRRLLLSGKVKPELNI